jgi:ADP-ribose pyrophosphatase YjhB (NUDIX family)
LKRDELIKILEENRIPIAMWGRGKAKTVEHLFEEVEAGETELDLSSGKLVRKVKVVALDVFYTHGDKTLVLVEDKQVFVDGRVRTRKMDSSLGEKMMPGEDPMAAARRAMAEELGIGSTEPVYQKTVTRGPEESPSYPGLLSLYVFLFHSVVLTDGTFRPEGYTEKAKDKTTYFVWREK